MSQGIRPPWAKKICMFLSRFSLFKRDNTAHIRVKKGSQVFRYKTLMEWKRLALSGEETLMSEAGIVHHCCVASLTQNNRK